jgi:hypothetical protein
MGKNEKAPFIVLDDVEYKEEDLTQEQKAMISHIADLERKIGSTQFNMDQMNVGKAAFINMLKESLTKPKDE